MVVALRALTKLVERTLQWREIPKHLSRSLLRTEFARHTNIAVWFVWPRSTQLNALIYLDNFRFVAKPWYSIVQLVFLRFTMQSTLAFYLKAMKGMHHRMAWFVSEDKCILCLRIDGIAQSAQIATPSSPKIALSCLSPSLSSSTSNNTSESPARPFWNRYTRCVIFSVEVSRLR